MIIITVTVFTIITIILIRERVKLKTELEHERASKLYEEIYPVSQVNTNITENVAYGGVRGNAKNN